MNAQIACPNCRSTISIPLNEKMLAMPLTCAVCGQSFAPHFYCPDERSPARHIFAASELLIDNLGMRYAFCPSHTYTSYALAEDSRPRAKRTALSSLARFFDSLIFRLTLSIEALRLQTFPRR